MSKMIHFRFISKQFTQPLVMAGTKQKPLFSLIHLAKLFKYSSDNYLISYYHDKKHYIKLYNQNYTNLEGINEVLLRSRKPYSKKILNEINQLSL